ncbi:hypothetical protein ASPZODRAFT_128673 [Penicilliopsis zonata CBS 506.65]|uniref:Laccase TilA n=1 Tax=Penicilliopsis zonata CBS 506.65 TaxID=1073090 RepID=A0A1L9SSI5_9EURO|nr:hypothetical protein ASPZODRAFT_128673 [Penicilliopsis zonata CBS 506.65]OJJ50067.1 hypothetical protein ASPZODRAFT_128673 [Penicilliopsis zonata CBS 506.65]
MQASTSWTRLLVLFLLTQWTCAAGRLLHFEVTLTWEDHAPAGTARKMILMNKQSPGPTLYMRQGDEVEFLVTNELPFATTVHFHGIDQQGTPWSDGVPGLSQTPIQPGCQFIYRWTAFDYGTYFYHAHSRGQIEDGLYGAIYIRPDDSVERPFHLITNDSAQLSAMAKAEEATQPVMLSDWRQLTSEQIWDAEEATGLDALCVNALLVNGKGSITCLSQQTLDEYTTAAQRLVLGNTSLTDIGCIPPSNVYAQGDYPHNYSAIQPSMYYGCTPSQGLYETFEVDPSIGYASYDLISAAGVSAPTYSIDEHPMWVYAIDGRYIEPTLVDAVTVYNGYRYSVLVRLDKPAGDYTVRVANSGLNQIINTTATMSYMTAAGRPSSGGRQSEPFVNLVGAGVTNTTTILEDAATVPFPVQVPSSDVAQTVVLTVGHWNASYRWQMGNTSFPLALEDDKPLLFDPASAPTGLTVHTVNGTWVDVIFNIDKAIQPPHPVHKHSNKYFVLGEGSGAWNYSSVAEAMQYIPDSFNLVTPQIRDSYITPPAATGPTWLAIRYQVVNPGAFLMHCHIQVHLSGGMAVAMLDGEEVWPKIPEEYRRPKCRITE